mmetsp:Transcript_48987/g.49742  ORF Transcript_48987/g.49742 Transcript_48987/m.49742 type:complete len:177 (+) Transcript_48987:844-1374(+)
MNCSNYINRFLKSHGWDVASDKPNTAPTTVTNSRTWDQWMEAGRIAEDRRLADLANESTDVEHAPAASVTTSITTTGLSSVHVNTPAPDLSDDELVTLQLKDKNINNEFAPMLTLPKGKVNENNFEDCMKSSRPIAPIPSGSIDQMFRDKGPPEGTAAHQVLETKSKFNQQRDLSK